jgi:hypothetical protein
LFENLKSVYTMSMEELYTLSHSSRTTGVAQILQRNNILEKMQIFGEVLKGWVEYDSKHMRSIRRGAQFSHLGEVSIALGSYTPS